MSLIQTWTDSYKKPWLASERSLRLVTATATQALGTAESGEIFVKAGTIFPSDDSNAEGIVFEDVKVTSGDMPCSIMTAGHVYANRLSITDNAKTALAAKGIIFETAVGMDREW